MSCQISQCVDDSVYRSVCLDPSFKKGTGGDDVRPPYWNPFIESDERGLKGVDILPILLCLDVLQYNILIIPLTYIWYVVFSQVVDLTRIPYHR